jgi:hypothetical protein
MRSGSLATTVTTAFVVFCFPAAAWACGACIEDSIAATYDHAVIKRALEKHQQVVFVAVEGDVRAGHVGRRIAAANISGVVPGSVRTSASPLAFSFGLEANRSPAHAIEAFRRALAAPGAQMRILRVVGESRLLAAQ